MNGQIAHQTTDSGFAQSNHTIADMITQSEHTVSQAATIGNTTPLPQAELGIEHERTDHDHCIVCLQRGILTVLDAILTSRHQITHIHLGRVDHKVNRVVLEGILHFGILLQNHVQHFVLVHNTLIEVRIVAKVVNLGLHARGTLQQVARECKPVFFRVEQAGRDIHLGTALFHIVQGNCDTLGRSDNLERNLQCAQSITDQISGFVERQIVFVSGYIDRHQKFHF